MRFFCSATLPDRSAHSLRFLRLDLRATTYNNMVVDSMNATFAALSDGTRREILFRLKDGPASVCELAEPFQISQQAISKHLTYLERARLIKKRRHGRQQICRLNAKPMQEVALWVEQYRQYWGEALGRLDALLHELHPPKKRSPKLQGGEL